MISRENVLISFVKNIIFLSNFYQSKLIFDGLVYYNSEAAYQAQKCKTEEEKKQFTKLPPNMAKYRGSKVEAREDWDDIKLEVMKQVVYAKFIQNPTLARDLLNTGNIELKEGNDWGDVYWRVDLKTGEGENHLDKLLMNLRSDFRENGIPCYDTSKLFVVQHFGKIELTDCDITLADTECIVNATNESIDSDIITDVAIRRSAGEEYALACRMLGGCKKSKAKITEGYCLNADYVIHTVGPKYPTENCSEYLAKCYSECLNLAMKTELHSIAFTPISIGEYSYPVKKACSIAVEAVCKWLEDNSDYDMRVAFCINEPSVYYSILENIREKYGI